MVKPVKTVCKQLLNVGKKELNAFNDEFATRH